MIYESTKQELERLRRKYVFHHKLSKLFRWLPLVMIAVIFIGCPIAFVCMSSPLAVVIVFGVGWFGGICSSILGIITENRVAAQRRKFQSVYKPEFVRDILEEQLEKVEYNGLQGFSRDEVRDFKLIRLSNVFRSEDYLRAQYKGVELEYSNILIMRKTNSRRELRFEGIFIKLPFPKRFSSVQIFSNSFKYRVCEHSPFLEVRGSVVPIGKYPSGQIQTGDMNFDNMFGVWSEDEQEPFYLLTPAFMESLKKLAILYPNMALHFTENNLYIAIDSGGDTFDCTMDAPIQYEEERKRIIEDVTEIKFIIDAIYPEN